jgi:hypothetical protein
MWAFCVLFGLFFSLPASAGPAAAPEALPFQRGLVYSSWDGSYPHAEAQRAHLDRFEAMGVQWLEVMTFARQPAVDAPAIQVSPAQKWPRAFIAEARRRGFRVFLKPHVWSPQFYDGSKRWRGSIRMADAAGWDRWFAYYERFLLAEAKRAAESGVEMLSVGLEYVEASKHGARWRALIAKVRRVYPGMLTYSADGNHELGHIDFWDALDVIGVNAYFALSDGADPAPVALALGWLPHLIRMEALVTRFKRPVVFTEAGYPSIVGAAARPWQWPNGQEEADAALQARAYEQLMVACTSVPWCRGVYWWKWYERPESTPVSHDYTPRGKPAEAVLARWYRRLSARSP